MQITLNQDEIEVAIKTYVLGQLTIREDQEIMIDLRAGRGENGFTATLDIRPRAMDNAIQYSGQRVAIEGAGAGAGPCVAGTEEPRVEEPKKPAAARTAKKSIFATVPKAVSTTALEESAKGSEEAVPGVPDQEKPAEEEARRAAAERDQEDAQDRDKAPAEQPETKRSIFTFAPKKSVG
jgi:hypothetical protein